MEKTAKKRGRPRHEPAAADRARVKMMAGLGIPDYDIAKVQGLSLPTLRRHYIRELEIGHIEASAQVGAALFKLAVAGNFAAQRFYLACRAGWIEARTPAPDRPPMGGEDEVPGKKESAQRAAIGAEVGTAWDGLLATPNRLN